MADEVPPQDKARSQRSSKASNGQQKFLEATLEGTKVIKGPTEDEQNQAESGREYLAAAAWAADLPIELAGKDKLTREPLHKGIKDKIVNNGAPPVQLS